MGAIEIAAEAASFAPGDMKSSDGHVLSGDVSEVSALNIFLGVFGQVCLFESMARPPDGEGHVPRFNDILSLASGCQWPRLPPMACLRESQDEP